MSLEVGYFAPHGEESHALILSGEVFRVRIPASVAPVLLRLLLLISLKL